MRLNSIMRLASRVSSGSDSIFSKTLIRATAKARLSSQPQFTPQQPVSTPQWSGGTSYHPVRTAQTSMAGYGVYLPAYLPPLEVASESPLNVPLEPENFDTPNAEPLIFDPSTQDVIFQPVDNVVAEDEPVVDEDAIEQAQSLADEIAGGRGLGLFGDDELNREEVIDRLEAGGYEVESSEWGLNNDDITRTTITDPETGETISEYYDHGDGTYRIEVASDEGEIHSAIDYDIHGREVVSQRQTPEGMTIREIVDEAGNRFYVVIYEDGTAIELDKSQTPSREGIDDISRRVSEGERVEDIAEELGVTEEQIQAQLNAAGFMYEEDGRETGSVRFERTVRIVSIQTGEEIARYRLGADDDDEIANSSYFENSDGGKFTRAEYFDGVEHEVAEDTTGRKTETRRNDDGETTTHVTDNGYTLTTPPDGDLTVRRNDNGREFTAERGTEEQALAEELLELNPLSDEDKALQAVIEELLVERDEDGNLKELEDLEVELGEQEVATQEAIAEILGEDADESDVIKPGQDVSDSDPLGAPPEKETSNGEDWVSMRYEGEWVWVDPAVAEALEKEEIVRAALERAELEALQRQLQIRFYYASGSGYEEIMERVEERINDLVAPHGKRWTPPELEATAEEVQADLEEVNAWIEYLVIEEEYQALQEKADDLKERALEIYSEDEDFEDYFKEEGFKEVIERHEGVQYSYDETKDTGELLYQTVVEKDGQLYLRNVYADRDDPLYVKLTQNSASEPNGLSEAQRRLNKDWNELKLGEEPAQLQNDALGAFREANPNYFDPDGYSEMRSSRLGGRGNKWSSGEFRDAQVVERGGQLYVIITHGVGSSKTTEEYPLTYASGEEPEQLTQAERDASKAWEKSTREKHVNSGDGSLLKVVQERAEAQRALNEIAAKQLGMDVELLEESIPDLEHTLEEAIGEHGEGTVVPGGEDAEQVEINGETRWVHPDVAVAHHELVAAREALSEGEDILERAKELYGEQHPDHVKPGGFYESRTEGNHTTFVPTGALMGESDGDGIFVDEDGQLYLRNRYEDRDDPYEFQLTHGPGSTEERTEAERQLDQEWADWWAEHGHDGDSEDPLAEAAQRKNGAEEARSGAIEAYGGGTTKELTDPLPDDVVPVLVIIDGEQRWVHPDVATALGALSIVQNQIASVRVAMEEVELALEEADYRLERPSTWKLLDDAASLEHEQSVMVEWQMQNAYLDANGTGGALARARQDQVENGDVLLATQIGLMEAGLPMASVHGDSPDLDVTELREMLEENGVLGEQLAESSQWNDFLRGQSLADRLEPDQGQALHERYFEQDPEVANDGILDRRDDLPSSVSMEKESAARQTLGDALGTHESAVVDSVVDQIRDLAGSDADVEIIPILYRNSSEGVRDTALFRVRDESDRAWLVDESGSKYRNLKDYRQHNYLSDKGHVFLPESPNRLTDASGDLTYEWYQARELSFTEQWLDPIIGIGTGIATVASFFPPFAPIAAPIAFAGGAYVGARSVSNIHEMHEHGRPLASTEGAMQGAMLVTSFFPMGASAFRTIGLTRAGIPTEVAVRTSTGAVNTWGRTWSQNPMYQEAAEQLTQRGVALSTARGLDRVAMGAGAPLMGYSGVNLATNWQDMTGLERSEALIGLGSGLFGAGMGYQALRATRPNQGAPETLAQGKLPAHHGTPTPPPGLSRLYRLGDLEALNQASVDGTLPAGHRILFVQPGRLDTTNFVLREGTVRRGAFVDGDGHIKKNNVDRSKGPKGPMGPVTFTVAGNSNGRQTIRLNGNGRTLHTEHFDGEAYVLVTNKSADQLSKAINPGKKNYQPQSQPFALYNGAEGNWSSAKSYESTIRTLLLSVGSLGGAISLGAPPEISMPLNALAKAVRGASLGIRSIAPEATAVNTGLGRTLRGVEFVTFAINIPGAFPTLEAGVASVQGVAYATGNSFYLVRTFNEAVTGRSVVHSADDMALPFFVEGGASGLATSLVTDSRTPSDTTLDVMLTVAATRLWFRDSALGQKFGSRLSSTIATKLPPLDKMITATSSKLTHLGEKIPKPLQMHKWDSATLVGFTGTLLPGPLLAMGNYMQEQKNMESEDIDPELPGYIPAGFSPPTTPSAVVETAGEPPISSDALASPQSLTELQLVVLDLEGLALHADPVNASTIVAFFPHGTFLKQGGSHVTDADGNEWVPVRLGSDGEPIGWAMAQGVTEHSSGAMGESGRFNPDYEGRYAAVTVEPHQTLGGIAVRKGHDIEQVVVLNLEHIIDPGVIYPGDRIYLPERQSKI